MKAKRSQKIVAAVLSVVLGAASSQLLYGYQEVSPTDPGHNPVNAIAK